MKEKLNKIIEQWYKDGLATWSYDDADGVDGKFGGSFHDHGELRDLDFYDTFDENCVRVPIYKLPIDYGSADVDKAIEDLGNRLKQSNLPFEVDDLYRTAHSVLYFYSTEDETIQK